MNYFEQLKLKHEDPTSAFLEYTLSKTLYRDYVVSESASVEIKESFKIQDKINNYCEAIIKGDKLNFIGALGISQQEIVGFYENNSEKLDFLGVNRELFINLCVDGYSSRLSSAKKNISWDKLKDLMLAEKTMI